VAAKKVRRPAFPPPRLQKTFVYQRQAHTKATNKFSAHEHRAPPRPPTAAAAEKKRAKTKVLSLVMKCGRERGESSRCEACAHHFSSPTLQPRPPEKMAAAGKRADRHGPSLRAE